MGQTVSQIFKQKGLWQWWTQNGGYGTNPYNGSSELGIDYSNAYGTPIGIPASGTVKAIYHNNNSINDIVVVQLSNGAAMWFQHINAAVKVGQSVGVGSVVGYQNGLPIDQYSTGSHIEVRYSNAWSSNPYGMQWVNPWLVFSTIGNTTGTPGTSSPGFGGGPGQPFGPGGWFGPGGPGSIGGTLNSVVEQVHATLVTNDGFYAIALAIDEAETFPGLENYATSVIDLPGMFKSVMATIVDNALAFSIRTTLIFLGMMLLIGLLWNFAKNSGILEIVGDVAKGAALAAA